MKKLSSLLLVLLSLSSFAQDKKLDCYEFMYYEQNSYYTDTTILSNGALLYRQWNCDSSWLTFEYENDKVLLDNCNFLDPIMCSRLGLLFIKEHPKYLFFIFNHISGCCDPPSLFFMDKTTGEEINKISSQFFVWGDSDENYALYFSDSIYTKLLYHDLEKDTIYSFNFKKREIDQAMRKHSGLFIKNLFSNFEKLDNQFFFDFKNKKGEVERLSILLE